MKFPIDIAMIKELSNVLNENGLTEINWEVEGFKIHLAKNEKVVPVGVQTVEQNISIEKTEPSWSSHPGVIKSPMVGTVYTASDPGAPSFVKLNDNVLAGQVLLIVESMKVMNPIKATQSGKVVHIFVNNAKPIEYGEPLIVIEPS